MRYPMMARGAFVRTHFGADHALIRFDAFADFALASIHRSARRIRLADRLFELAVSRHYVSTKTDSTRRIECRVQ